MEKLLLARDSNRVITEINHVEHAWELHSHKHKATAHLHQYMHTHTDICKSKTPVAGEIPTTQELPKRLYYCKHSLSE